MDDEDCSAVTKNSPENSGGLARLMLLQNNKAKTSNGVTEFTSASTAGYKDQDKRAVNRFSITGRDAIVATGNDAVVITGYDGKPKTLL